MDTVQPLRTSSMFGSYLHANNKRGANVYARRIKETNEELNQTLERLDEPLFPPTWDQRRIDQSMKDLRKNMKELRDEIRDKNRENAYDESEFEKELNALMRIKDGLGEPLKLKLMPTQLAAQKRQDEIFEKHKILFNVSEPSAGKTTQSLEYAYRNKMEALVFCSKGAMIPWIIEGNIYGIKTYDIISYSENRGMPDQKTTKSGFLNIIGEGDNVTYQATDEFLKVVARNVFIIVDEVHNVFNSGAKQSQATFCLLRAAITYLMKHPECKTRLALLSGSLGTKAEHIIWYIYAMGYVSDQTPSENGVKELLRVAKEHDLGVYKELSKLWTRSNGDKSALKMFYKKFWMDFVKINQMIQAPRPDIIKPDITNKIYDIAYGVEGNAEEMRKEYKDQIAEIVEKIDSGKAKLSPFDSTLEKVCTLSAPLYSKIVLDTFEENKNAKCIVVMPFTNGLTQVNDAINEAGYNSVIFNGQTSIQKRIEIIKQFNADNNELNCICVQIKTGSEAISLQDLHGDRPRYMFIFPTYSFINEYQAIFRIYRPGSRTKSTIVFVYCVGALDFISIRQNREEKNKSLKDFGRLGESFDTSKGIETIHHESAIKAEQSKNIKKKKRNLKESLKKNPKK